MLQTSQLLIILLFVSTHIFAQDDLMDLLEQETQDSTATIYTEGTFSSSRIINGHSVELRSPGVLEALISHRFGCVCNGISEFFGLDDANTRIALEFGIAKNLNIGIGRSTLDKQFDGFIKYRLFRQQQGYRNIPLTAVFFTSMAVNSTEAPPDLDWDFANRTNYTYQLLLARKFSQNFSLQLNPTLVHKNLVEKPQDDNDRFALGIGARHKVTKRMALTLEYYYNFNQPDDQDLYNSFSVGVDIETGGHVFQLHLTNSRAIIENGFITETTDDFFDGEMHIGFNISRVFNISKKSQTSESW
ncbi:MAG: hypothetical protein DHS20C17_35300 [Cyclobacteriaceae bacterium]|nr:MAG: hypothetical protein DHS20C17_35300 [Cyclobacteriaceae bacterium]